MWLVIALSSLAWGHGGPEAYQILPDGETAHVITTNGLFTGSEGDWAWVCEEAWDSGIVLAAGRSGDRLVLATNRGVYWSDDDGCSFTRASGPDGTYVSGLAIRGEDHWISGYDALWYSTDADDWTRVSGPWNEGLRGVAASADGTTLYVFSYEDEAARVWVGHPDTGWQSVTIAATSDFLLVHGVDSQDRALISLPFDGSDRLVRIDEDAVFDVLVQTERPINAVISAPVLRVSLFAAGSIVSYDDGATWSEPTPPVLTSLTRVEDTVYAGTEFSQRLPAVLQEQGGEVTPWLRFDEVSGPKDCPAGGVVTTTCEPLWDATRDVLLGIVEPIETVPPQEEPTSCAAPLGAVPLWLAGVGLLGLRRRR